MRSLTELIGNAGWHAWPRTRIRVSGEDAQSLLHNMCTNNVNELQPGQGCEAFFCDPRGRTVGFANVLRRDDCLVVETSPGQYDSLVSKLDRYVISEDVTFSNLDDSEGQLLAVGREALNQLGLADKCSESLNCVELEIDGAKVRIAQLLIHDGCAAVLQYPLDRQESVIAHLSELGAEELTDKEVELTRISSGYPTYGVDLDQDNFPQEADRDSLAINFHKGCYIGQETVARIDAMGHVNRMLTGVSISGEHELTGVKLSLGDKEVGQVTSHVTNRETDETIGIATIRCEARTAEQQLQSTCGEVEVRSFPIQ